MKKSLDKGFVSVLKIFVALMVVFVVSSALPPAEAKNGGKLVTFNDWIVVGPEGGDVRVITHDPRNKDRLYISTLDGQIHTSADGGKTWRLLVNFNRPQLILDQLIVDSRDSNVLYTSGHRHKLPGAFFKSTDGGKTWKEALELSGESIHAMTQSTKNPDILLVGTINGVWISRDSGDSWEQISSDTMPVNIDALAIDPRDDGTIFAGTWWRAYKTTDSGQSWRLIKKGMIDDSDVFAITVNPRDPDHLVASACSGIYESFNNGERWRKIQGIPSQSRRTRDIVQHPTIPGRIYAATTEGFWMSVNGGKTWSLTTRRDLEINSISVHPDEPEKVFIGTNNHGVMVSEDGGRNFVETNTKFSSRFTYSVKIDNERPERLYATTQNTATGGGFVFVSDNGGQSWSQAENLDVMRISPFALIQDRVNPDTIYLGTNVGVFQSLDRGVTWEHLRPPKKKRTNTSRGRRRAKPKPTPEESGNVAVLTEKIKVLSYTEDGKNGIYAGTDKGLYRTYDISKGWEKVFFPEGIDDNIFVVYTTPLQPETVYVGTAVSGVLVSRDNGETWQQMSDVPERVPVSSIMVDPKDPAKIYVGTTQTFYLSRDGGETWTRRGGNLPLGNYTSILINPENTDEIYVASSLESDGGIFYSDDAGWNWTRIDKRSLNLPSHRIWSMSFDPNNVNRIFAGTHSSGVYVIERKVTTAKSETEDETKRPRVTGTAN